MPQLDTIVLSSNDEGDGASSPNSTPELEIPVQDRRVAKAYSAYQAAENELKNVEKLLSAARRRRDEALKRFHELVHPRTHTPENNPRAKRKRTSETSKAGLGAGLTRSPKMAKAERRSPEMIPLRGTASTKSESPNNGPQLPNSNPTATGAPRRASREESPGALSSSNESDDESDDVITPCSKHSRRSLRSQVRENAGSPHMQSHVEERPPNPSQRRFATPALARLSAFQSSTAPNKEPGMRIFSRSDGLVFRNSPPKPPESGAENLERESTAPHESRYTPPPPKRTPQPPAIVLMNNYIRELSENNTLPPAAVISRLRGHAELLNTNLPIRGFARQSLVAVLGGNSRTMWPNGSENFPKPYAAESYICAKRNLNLWLPQKPGHKGAITVFRFDKAVYPKIYPLFIGETADEWVYFGHYRVVGYYELPLEEWNKLSPERKLQWCDHITSTAWGQELLAKRGIPLKTSKKYIGRNILQYFAREASEDYVYLRLHLRLFEVDRYDWGLHKMLQRKESKKTKK